VIGRFRKAGGWLAAAFELGLRVPRARSGRTVVIVVVAAGVHHVGVTNRYAAYSPDEIAQDGRRAAPPRY